MSYTLTDEKIIELAEKEVKQHIHKVLQGFARDNHLTTEGYDVRMEKVVRETLREYFNYHYNQELKPIFEKAIKEIVVKELPELIAGQLKDLLNKL